MYEELTPKQREVIEYMVEHLGASIPQVAEACGVHYNSVYKWRKQEKFQRKLDEELHRIFKEGARVAMNTMLSLAMQGDRQASQYILDNVGFKEAEKVELNGDMGVGITIDYGTN